jgi:predicted MFS family arabinose efflux permease
MSNIRAATWATRANFFYSGFLFATWGVHVPTVREHYGLGEQALAMAMLAAGVGALAGLTQAGRVIGRVGAKPVTLASGLVVALCIAALLWTRDYTVLVATMVGFGIASGLLDVAINAEATELEHVAQRKLMSGFHGMFSLGGMAGAAAGGALLAADVMPDAHLWGVAFVGALALAVATALMLPFKPPADGAAAGFELPRGSLLLLGVLAALGLIAEGAMYDWSVLYMHRELGSPQQQAALAYASFSAAMAAARFGGDWVRERTEPASLMRWSAALSAAAMAATLLIGQPWVALVGFALVGVGMANVVPVLFSAAARVPGTTPAHGIAAVSSVGYLGFMVGPPLIGVVAQRSSLALALSLVVMFAATLALAAHRALR